MTTKTVYLITGANKGIGHALVEALLQRPNTTVIATARAASLPAFKKAAPQIPAHETSNLHVLVLDDAATETSSAALAGILAELHEADPSLGLDHIDVVVANAGTSASFKDVASTDPEDMVYDFTVNAVGPAKLFRALWPLLRISAERKFVLISTWAGSIGGLDIEGFPCTSYGMSKAAANWWAKKTSLEFKDHGLKVGIVHPGWVQTSMGQGLADVVGLDKPPMTTEVCAEKVLEQIDLLNMDRSGKFLSYDGTDLPW